VGHALKFIVKSKKMKGALPSSYKASINGAILLPGLPPPRLIMQLAPHDYRTRYYRLRLFFRPITAVSSRAKIRSLSRTSMLSRPHIRVTWYWFIAMNDCKKHLFTPRPSPKNRLEAA